MTQITSHILDTSQGKPAADVSVSLMQQNDDGWLVLGSASTNDDGRISDFLGAESTKPNDTLPGGIYKLTFQLKGYFERSGIDAFYPYAEVVFQINGDGQHYHVPLLLNPYGYSTYRGS